jgi:hypothetical protein
MGMKDMFEEAVIDRLQALLERLDVFWLIQRVEVLRGGVTRQRGIMRFAQKVS